jgi:hypothetical protein
MKATSQLVALIAAAILAGCTTTSPHHDYSGVPAAHFLVTVSCNKPGMKFTGTIVSDGHTENLAGSGTRTFHATGHEIVCSFKKTSPEGQISISVSEAGNDLGNSSTAKRFGGVRADIVRTSTAQNTIFTAF